MKSTGSFVKDISSGMDVVRITKVWGINIDADIAMSVVGGVTITGSVTIGDLPGLSASIDATVSGDRVDMIGTTAVQVARLIITKDRVDVSQSGVLGNYLISLSNGEGLNASVNLLIVSGGTSVSFDEISLDFGLGSSSMKVTYEPNVIDLAVPGSSAIYNIFKQIF